jgi:hypothetical protein
MNGEVVVSQVDSSCLDALEGERSNRRVRSDRINGDKAEGFQAGVNEERFRPGGIKMAFARHHKLQSDWAKRAPWCSYPAWGRASPEPGVHRGCTLLSGAAGAVPARGTPIGIVALIFATPTRSTAVAVVRAIRTTKAVWSILKRKMADDVITAELNSSNSARSFPRKKRSPEIS